MIGFGQAIVYFAIIFTAIAVSGFGSGLLVLSDINNKKSLYRRQTVQTQGEIVKIKTLLLYPQK